MLRKILYVIVLLPLSMALTTLLLLGLEWPKWIAFTLGLSPLYFLVNVFGQSGTSADPPPAGRAPKRRDQ